MPHQELEVKLFVSSLDGIEQFLIDEKAQLFLPRALEINYRLDDGEGSLTKSGRVLRVRKGQTVTVTYKDIGQEVDGVRVRPEIEFQASDENQALLLFSAIGFQTTLIYEKYRREYLWNELHVSLDELPYGSFVEVEGKETAQIYQGCLKLGLDWKKRIGDSYVGIFKRIDEAYGLQLKEATFEVFQSWKGTLLPLGITPADQRGISGKKDADYLMT